ncbi:SOS response-associated peptidase [Ahrensia sp. R2A130]|uniref:SOS response-associated peptidase n=1 Tax=Ahrensia sp. R2A130 TaxID=744979 RepID=UPI0001E0A437|nr:SOS response-associated peptidase [Ahrensia sp. R2A130]EFL90639.1 protein YoaM [Ahrensia sp. R2A130]
MCGRFSLETNWTEMVRQFALRSNVDRGPALAPRLNIAPTQPILMVGELGGQERNALLVRWGFLPTWVEDPKDFPLIINARSETAISKPSFRHAMRHRRALIPVSGFYEWQRFGKGQPSQPYYVRPRDDGIIAFGALMETWTEPGGTEMDTGCIITTAANDSFAPIHHRLPLVIQPKDFDRWLDCRTQEPRDVADLMVPVQDDFFEAIPVGKAVNKVANDARAIQTRVEPMTDDGKAPEAAEQQLSMF